MVNLLLEFTLTQKLVNTATLQRALVTPYGIFLPELDELFLYFTESKVTSDFIVDILEDFWGASIFGGSTFLDEPYSRVFGVSELCFFQKWMLPCEQLYHHG